MLTTEYHHHLSRRYLTIFILRYSLPSNRRALSLQQTLVKLDTFRQDHLPLHTKVSVSWSSQSPWFHASFHVLKPSIKYHVRYIARVTLVVGVTVWVAMLPPGRPVTSCCSTKRHRSLAAAVFPSARNLPYSPNPAVNPGHCV